MKIIKHNFLNKHTIPGALLLMLWGLLFSEMIVGGVFTIPDLILDPETREPVIGAFGSAAAAFLVLSIHWVWFYPEFEGCLKSKVPFSDICRIAAAIIPFWLITIIKEIAAGNSFHAPTIRIIAMALMAGCCEEVSFRGLGISYLMRQWKDEKKILPALVFTSVIFGLVHASNIISGAGVLISIIQSVSAAFIGLFLGAVFLRGGNLWAAIIIHVIHDILSGMFLTEGFVLTHTVTWSDWLDMLICALLGAAGLYLVRGEKRAEIAALWAQKWAGTAGDPEISQEAS